VNFASLKTPLEAKGKTDLLGQLHDPSANSTWLLEFGACDDAIPTEKNPLSEEPTPAEQAKEPQPVADFLAGFHWE
jgi:hypothetical protein